MSAETREELATMLGVQAARVRMGLPAMTGVAVDVLRKCRMHGLHNAWFQLEGGDVVCLWCEKDERHGTCGAAESG